jgi:demethylphylloquinone reductase
MTQSTQQICILGGGFGGLFTALRLSRLPWPAASKPKIVLVDQSDRFLFTPFLYELVTGELQTWEIAPPFAEVLAGTGIHFQQAAVDRIDLQEQRVLFQDDSTIPYNYLVLALGGETPLNQVPGVAEYAIPFRTLADAYRLEERLRSLEGSEAEKIRIAIVGGGPSGVELSCKLADRLQHRGRIRLIEQTDQILRSASEFNREAAHRELEKQGVWLDLETTVESLGMGSIQLTYKGQTDEIPVDVVLWTVGTAVAPSIQDLPLKRNVRGQLVTTPTLQLVQYPEVFALGDLADCRDGEGRQIPNTAQAAFQQADYTAWNLWATLTDRPLLPFRYSHLGEILTLGTDTAAFSGLGLKLEGPLAYLFRRLAYLYRMPTLEHQLKVGFHWMTQPLLTWLVR